MLTILNDIKQAYNPKEYKALYKKTEECIWRASSGSDYYGTIMLFPFKLFNKDKNITVTNVCKSYITQEDIQSTYFMDNLLKKYKKDTNEEIKVIYCKKGYTFLYKYLEDHNYTYLNRESLYLQIQATHRIKAFKKDNQITIVSNIDSDIFEHRLFSAVPLFFKDNFTWNEELVNYFKNIENTNKQSFELFKKFVKDSKILENLKQEELLTALTEANNYSFKQHQIQIKVIESKITEYEEYLEQQYKKLYQEQAFLAFSKPTIDIEDLAKYIMNNPNIVDIYNKDQKYLIIAIEAPLEYIEVPAFKTMLKNINSYLYPKWASPSNQQYNTLTQTHPIEFVEMLKDLFLTGKYKVYSRAEIVLDLENKVAFPLRRNENLLRYKPENWTLHHRYENNKNRCIVPHMHIEYYDCWAGNKTNISKALKANDLIGAIYICINTVNDIIVNDSAVFGRFIREELIHPQEFKTGYITSRNTIPTSGIPGDEFKTIWDTTNKCFRTFSDIFIKEYLKEKVTQLDLDIDFTDYII